MANLSDPVNTWHTFAGGSGFGTADYHTILRLTVGLGENGKTFADITEDDRQKLIARKAEIIAALNDNTPQGLGWALNPNNKPGAGPNSVYEEIVRNDIGTWHGWDETVDTPEEYESRRGNFGGTDYLHALASGHTRDKVLTWLESNYDKLAGNHLPIGKGGSSTGLYTQLAGETASTDFGKPKPDVVPGAGGTKYGNIDYFTQLKVIWDTHKDPELLYEYREETLNFLATASDDQVAPQNRPGGGGLWDTITSHKRVKPRDFDAPKESGANWAEADVKISPWWGDRSTPEGKEHAEQEFTEADYLAARAGGHSDYDIYRHLRRNKSQYSSIEAREFNTSSKEVYDRVRQGLIERSPMYSFIDDGAERQDNWRAVLENPIWQEVGEYISATDKRYDDYDWINSKDYDIIERYIMNNYKPKDSNLTGAEIVESFKTDEQLKELIGFDPGEGPDKGDYWEQYGASGPPDRDQDDGKDAGDLTWIEKMVAQAGLESLDSSQWKDRLEYLETRFLNELYKGQEYIPNTGKGRSQDAVDPQWQDAPDSWGLDIMRLDEEGKSLDFRDSMWDDNDKLKGDEGEEWYETLTKGDIDWAFYQDSKIYQQAKQALGLEGKYTMHSLGVEGIRKANVWVHGQLAHMPAEGGPEWDPYKAKPLPVEYVPTELNITGYTPEDKKGLAPVKDAPTAPTINLPDVKLERPDNLDSKLGTLVGE